MKRVLFIAPVALVVFALGRGFADYIVVKIDVTKNYMKEAPAQGQGGMGMRGGMMGMMGGMGMRGGMMGMMGGMGMRGGMMGMMGGMGMRGGMMGMMGGMGMRGGMPGGGMMGGMGMRGGMPGGMMGMMGGGMRGGMPGGGNQGGYPMPGGGNQGGYPMPGGGNQGGGFPGGSGAGFGGGAGGGLPGSSKPGTKFPGGSGAFAGAQPNQGTVADDAYQPYWIYAYVELRGKPKFYFEKGKPTHLEFAHVWGHTCRLPVEFIRLPYRPDSTNMNEQVIQQDSLGKQYSARLRDVTKRKDTVGKLRLAEWALEHGMLEKFHALMADLRKARDDSGAIKAALASYDRVRAELQKRPAGGEAAHDSLLKDLTRDGYRLEVSEPGHYAVATNLPANRQQDIQRWLGLMEETHEKFFYWFATHSDQLPPVPSRRLLGILVANPAEFYEKRAAWGWLPMVADGFLPRRDNIMVLSAEHLDEAFALLRSNNQEILHGTSRDDLLTGDIWKRTDPKKEGKTNLTNYSYQQALVLVEKAVQSEAERATISHEATRQLLFATGLLPRNVDVPEWIQYGLASFFETPPTAFYPGIGLPSWTNLLKFRYWQDKQKLRPDAEIVLRVTSDKYFQRADDAEALFLQARDNQKLADKAQENRALAQATAWALVYHLAKTNRLSLLLRYSQELDRLPRDLQLADRVLRGCFGRASELKTPDDFRRFAETWFAAMSHDQLEIPEYGRDFLDYLLHGSTKSKTAVR